MMADLKQGRYEADNIQVLEGLEAVRKRPGMYIGSTSLDGLLHLVYEVVDNSIDEVLADYCDKIKIIINEDNSVTVIDNGRGIPVASHAKKNRPAVEVVMTVLHAGGKFEGKGYKVSGGLHGVGVSVVNALSEWMTVEVKWKDNNIYKQKYRRGVPVYELKKIGHCEEGRETGTKITFKPDPEIFEEIDFRYDKLLQRFKEMAFLNKGILIKVIDKRDQENIKENEFHYEGGIVQFVKYLNKNKKTLFSEPIYIEEEGEKEEVEISFQYHSGFKERIFSFANNINTREGGTHLSGFKSALTRTVNGYARSKGLLKEKDANLTGEDVREGITAIINIKLEEPQFEGQTKTKLGNSNIRGFVDSSISQNLKTFMEENPSIAKII